MTTSNQVDLYLRLSNANENSDSLERQEHDLREWATREGLSIRTVWKDYGRSGYKPGVRREGFDSALAALAAQEVGTLAVWKLDRLTRQGMKVIGELLESVAVSGGRLVFLRDGLDTANGAAARIPLGVLSELARGESENISLRVRSRKAADRRAGRYLGGAAPYGYVVTTDRRLRPNEDPFVTITGPTSEYALARDLVRRVLDGDSLLAVARDWNAQNVPTRRGGTWRPSTLSNVLRSPTLNGLMTEMVREAAADGTEAKSIRPYRDPETGEYISLMAEGFAPIATASEQARALSLMDGRLRRYGRGTGSVRTPKSLLGMVAKCDSCGRALTTFGDSYRCKRAFTDGSNCASPVSVSVGVLDDAVRRAWSRRLAASEHDAGVLARVGARWLERFDPSSLHEHRELQQQIADAEERLSLAADDHYIRGTLDRDRFARVSTGLTERLGRLRARLAELPSPEADLSALLDPELSLPGIEAAPVAEARDLLRLVIEGVYVSRAPRRGARFSPQERIRFAWAE